jgi:DNA (cytosine-5)-methyltransferase 1
MNHLDLFSGIGGFAYAVDQVWDNAKHVFCEIDPFCQQVLKKHWSDSEIYEDIRTITNTPSNGCWKGTTSQIKKGLQSRSKYDGQLEGGLKGSHCFLLTGGFPCQPFSAAGKRKGTDDNRYLWHEMFRVIQLTKPTWIIAENVGGFVTMQSGMVLEQVCTDLENEGYEVQPFIIPAIAVNAPHRRDRVWIVANSTSKRDGGIVGEERAIQERKLEQNQSKRGEIRCKGEGCIGNAPDTCNKRLERGSNKRQRLSGFKNRNGSDQRRDWNENWVEVATEICSVDDGLPVELDGFKLTKAGNRREQLKAYGNAIVPAVAVQIMRAIKQAEKQT